MLVILAPRAERDIDEIVLARAGASVSWMFRLRAAIGSLGTHTERFARANEADNLGVELREMLIGKRRNTFRILFTIDGTTVNVHHIRLGSRGPVRRGDLF